MIIFRCEMIFWLSTAVIVSSCQQGHQSSLTNEPLAELIRKNIASDELDTTLEKFAKTEYRDRGELRSELVKSGFSNHDQSENCEILAADVAHDSFVEGGMTQISVKLCKNISVADFDVTHFGAME